MKLLLTRHGQSRWQVEGERAGADAGLSPLGVIQAHRLGAYLRDHLTVDRIISSSLQRAHHTATIINSYLNIPLAVDPELREFESWEAGHAPHPTSIWDPTPAESFHPEHQAFKERVGGALERAIGTGEQEESVLVVAHGGTIGAVLRLLLGAMTQRLWTGNTALHALEWTGEYWLIGYVNRMEHLAHPLRSW
jgi:broad specificity phosphatase PhoE